MKAYKCNLTHKQNFRRTPTHWAIVRFYRNSVNMSLPSNVLACWHYYHVKTPRCTNWLTVRTGIKGLKYNLVEWKCEIMQKPKQISAEIWACWVAHRRCYDSWGCRTALTQERCVPCEVSAVLLACWMIQWLVCEPLERKAFLQDKPPQREKRPRVWRNIFTSGANINTQSPSTLNLFFSSMKHLYTTKARVLKGQFNNIWSNQVLIWIWNVLSSFCCWVDCKKLFLEYVRRFFALATDELVSLPRLSVSFVGLCRLFTVFQPWLKPKHSQTPVTIALQLD